VTEHDHQPGFAETAAIAAETANISHDRDAGAVPPGETTPPNPLANEAREYALPFVIHVEKADPPHRTDAIEAAARATLVFLSDPRVTEADGEWAGAVRRWTDGRIRKVVRRARGANWRRAEALPGITIVHRSAEVRVYPPVPNDDWPPDLSRLQVSGTDLEDPGQLPIAPNATPVLYLNPHLSMTAGKAMAQAGHGAQLAWWEADAEGRSAWKGSGFDLAVRTAEPGQWEGLLASGLPVVQDGGFTEVEPGSYTVVADLPALRAPSGLCSRNLLPAQRKQRT
jgi:peptidyl-tRNA hydrolase